MDHHATLLALCAQFGKLHLMRYSLLHCGLLALTGPDAPTFLHNLVSCDVAGLPANRSTYGSFCTPKGRMLASFLLWRTDEGCLMQLPASLRESARKRLAMYILRSKVRIDDVTDRHAAFGIAGEGAVRFVERELGTSLTEQHEAARTPRGTALNVSADRRELIVPRQHAEAMRAALASSAEEAADDWWTALDIRDGIGWVLPQTQEQFVPQSLNLDAIGGVSFNKGCYPGQEIVARMHYLGRLKERMYRVHVSDDKAPCPGDKLFGADLGEQAAGTIVVSVPAAAGGFDALAVIRLGSVAAGPVRLQSPAGPSLEILPLPYELPSA